MEIPRWKLHVLTMVVQTSTLTALVIDQRSCNLASTRLGEGSVVPELAAVPVFLTVTDVLLRDVGTEVEDRPTSGLGGLSGDGRQGEKNFGVHFERRW